MKAQSNINSLSDVTVVHGLSQVCSLKVVLESLVFRVDPYSYIPLMSN